MSNETITVQLPVKLVTDAVLGLNGYVQVTRIDHWEGILGRHGEPYYVEMRATYNGCAFQLKEMGSVRRDVFLSWETIFTLAARVEKLLDAASYPDLGDAGTPGSEG